MRRTALVVLSTLALACSAIRATPAPSDQVSVAPAAPSATLVAASPSSAALSPSPRASDTPIPSVSATPATPTPSPQETGVVTTSTPPPPVATLSPDAVGWVRIDTDVFANVPGFESSATNDGVTVVSGGLITDPDSLTGYGTTWSTRDGSTWSESAFWSALESENPDLLSVTAYGSGFLAFGSKEAAGSRPAQTLIYSSADGDAWQPLSSIDGVAGTDVAVSGDHLMLAATGANIERSLWTSTDGNNWTQQLDGPVSRIADFDTTLVGTPLAFFAVVPTDTGLDLWRGTDGAAWTKAATFAGPANFTGEAGGEIVAGERGLVLTAWFETDSNPNDMSWRVKNEAWWSSDGTNWERAPEPPTDVTVALGYNDGFIAGAYRDADGCCDGTGIWDGRGTGETWVSDDGKSWHVLQTTGWKNQAPTVLEINGGTLIALSIDPRDLYLTPPAGLWLANVDTFGR